MNSLNQGFKNNKNRKNPKKENKKYRKHKNKNMILIVHFV